MHHSDAFDYWGKGTQVTVSDRKAPAGPVTVYGLKECSSNRSDVVIGCISTGLSDQTLPFTWKDSRNQNLDSVVQYPPVEINGAYSKISQVTVNKGTFTCNIDNKPATITVTSPPVITLGKVGQNIACVIEHFFPEELSVKWREDGQEVTGRDWTTEKCPVSTSHKVISLLAASQNSQKKDTEYICEVTHLNKTDKVKMVFKAQFFVKINSPLQKEVFVHAKAKIQCVITGDNEMQVKKANVSWTFGGQTVEQTSITDGQVERTTDQLYTKTSTLTINKNDWFSGKTIKCSTSRGDETVFDEIAFKTGGDPSVLIYKPDYFTSEANVSMLCEVKGSNLGDVYIMWTLNNKPYEEGNGMTRINNKDKTSVVLSYYTMPAKDYINKNTFTCAVQYATKDLPKETTTSMRVLPEQDSGLYINCDKDSLDEDDYNSLWSTASSFIFLFLFSIVYSTVLSLTKMKQ